MRRTAHGGQGDDRPRLIGLTGPSGSGKSTLAKAIQEESDVGVVILDQDWYFMARSECPIGANFCEPRWLHTEELVLDVSTLASGRAALVPRLDEELFEPLPPVPMEPAPVVVLTGMTLLRIPAIDGLLDSRYYMDPGLETIAARKWLRDTEIRKKPKWVIEEEIRWGKSEYEADAPLRARTDVEVLVSPFDLPELAARLLAQVV